MKNNTYTSFILWESLHNKPQGKGKTFQIFISKQCSLLTNHIHLPISLSFPTDKRLSSVIFSAEDIGKIIQGLNQNKVHSHDNISIRMLKICDDIICKPLEMIFSQALTSGLFPSEWKKGNIIPIHKQKNDKQNLINYWPVSKDL